MKQEIVIKVQMRCDKCRTKAMELVASADGVDSVSLTGEDRNQVVVVGDGVDAVSLASILRKKVGPTDIIKVGEPKKNGNGKNGKNSKDGKKDDSDKKKEKSKDSEKEKEKEKEEESKNGKKNEEQKYQYQYQYQQQGPKMEYVQAQQQWYPGYPTYPQIVVYDSPSYSNPNCSIM